ncbi:hypothetical protein FDP41_012698 [Naegleria fowleri]|uniref:Uncharacterized protein n=1 Tax=Naegleria fowleri TaxID=5763 RepID=A0A6A5C4W6_NAEFO|nr:uncharacterized protein FDP41_012698 [Naegleria fowleri]KAF0980910.1 hypothetical protein FDP41_012698 [Naegleria fowleri]
MHSSPPRKLLKIDTITNSDEFSTPKSSSSSEKEESSLDHGDEERISNLHPQQDGEKIEESNRHSICEDPSILLMPSPATQIPSFSQQVHPLQPQTIHHFTNHSPSPLHRYSEYSTTPKKRLYETTTTTTNSTTTLNHSSQHPPHNRLFPSNLSLPFQDHFEHDITQSPAFPVLRDMLADTFDHHGDSSEEKESVVSLSEGSSLSGSSIFSEPHQKVDSQREASLSVSSTMHQSQHDVALTLSVGEDVISSSCSQQVITHEKSDNIDQKNSELNHSQTMSSAANATGGVLSEPKPLICKEIEPKDIKLDVLNLNKKGHHIRVLLVRHGQCITNVQKTILQEKPDHSIPLSKIGEEQAKAAGVYIRRFYEEMNQRLKEQIDKHNLKYIDISNRKFSNSVKHISNETTDFKFDNDDSDTEEDAKQSFIQNGKVPHEKVITYPLRVRLWNSTYNRARMTAEYIMKEASNVIQDQRESILLVEQQFGLFEGVPLEELANRFPQEFRHFEKHICATGRFYARPPLGESRFDVSKRVQLLFDKFIEDSEKEYINDIVIVSHGVTVRSFTQSK